MANLPNVVNVLKFRPRATHQDESTNLDSTGHKDREGFVVVEIKPGKRYKLEAQIAAVPTTLIWEFSTQDLDIAFSAKFQPKNPKAAPLVIRELRRVKCNVMARIGQFTCREPGAIHLVWDNRYSHFRKKQLYFRIYQAHGTLLKATSTLEFYGSPEYKAMERTHKWWENAVEEQKRRERWDRCLNYCKKLREEFKRLSKNERAFCWLHNSRALYKRCQLPDSYYFNLKLKIKDALTPHEQQLIEKDVGRTFPKVFRDPQRDMVRTVLQCYAVRFQRRNNAVGYTQGMNYLVGIALLAGLREEHCFWLLTTITENWCRYFDVNLTSLKIDLQVVNDLLFKHVPRLMAHLHKLQCPVEWFLSSMLICSFSNTLPVRLLFYFWDIMFMVREPVAVFAAVLCFMKTVEDRVLKLASVGECMEFFAKELETWREDDSEQSISHFMDLTLFWILQLLDENINALRATAQQKLEAMTPVPSPTTRRPMHASRHIVDQRRIDEQAGQSRATPVIFVKDGPGDFDGDQDSEHRTGKARRFRPDSLVVVDVERSQNLESAAVDEVGTEPNLEATEDSESFAERFGEAAHLSSPQHFHSDLPDSAFGSDVNATIDGDDDRSADEFGSPHHHATPKHAFRQSAVSTDLPDVRTEVKAARQPLPPPQAQPDTPHSLTPHSSLPSPIQTTLDYDQLRQEKMNEARASLEEAPSARRRVGRHKKGPKHQFGLQKGWQSPRSRSNSAASPDNGSYEHLFSTLNPDSSGVDGGELDANDRTQETDNESRSPSMSSIHEHVSDHGDGAMEEPTAGSPANAESEYPGEWERHYDETEESYFFYCPDTDQSVWEEDIWTTEFDEASGRYYYVNQLTGESQWQQSEADGVYDAATEAYASYEADHSQDDASSSPHTRDSRWEDNPNENLSAASMDGTDGTNGAAKHEEDPAGLGILVQDYSKTIAQYTHSDHGQEHTSRQHQSALGQQAAGPVSREGKIYRGRGQGK